MKKLVLKDRESIVTAYAQSAAGPGWSNAPICVIVRDANHNLREECIQPEDQTALMVWLYGVSAAAHGAMVAAVRGAMRKKNP